MIPTRQDIYNLMDKYMVPIGVRKHCEVVNRVAVFLAKKLKAAGVDVDVDLVDAASLLHDLMRMINFYSFEGASREQQETWEKLKEKFGHVDHSEAAYEVLKDIYPRVAEAVARHSVESVIEGKLKTWEDKLVTYADRRVVHTRIVSLDERYEDAKLRHADFYEKAELDPDVEKKKIKKIESEIFDNLKFRPEELKEEMTREK